MTRDTSKNVSKQVLKYGSGAKKGVTRDTSKDPKPAAKKPTPKPAAVKPAKPAKNSTKAASNFYRSSSGTRGQLRPSNPPHQQLLQKLNLVAVHV